MTTSRTRAPPSTTTPLSSRSYAQVLKSSSSALDPLADLHSDSDADSSMALSQRQSYDPLPSKLIEQPSSCDWARAHCATLDYRRRRPTQTDRVVAPAIGPACEQDGLVTQKEVDTTTTTNTASIDSPRSSTVKEISELKSHLADLAVVEAYVRKQQRRIEPPPSAVRIIGPVHAYATSETYLSSSTMTTQPAAPEPISVSTPTAAQRIPVKLVGKTSVSAIQPRFEPESAPSFGKDRSTSSRSSEPPRYESAHTLYVRATLQEWRKETPSHPAKPSQCPSDLETLLSATPPGIKSRRQRPSAATSAARKAALGRLEKVSPLHTSLALAADQTVKNADRGPKPDLDRYHDRTSPVRPASEDQLAVSSTSLSSTSLHTVYTTPLAASGSTRSSTQLVSPSTKKPVTSSQLSPLSTPVSSSPLLTQVSCLPPCRYTKPGPPASTSKRPSPPQPSSRSGLLFRQPAAPQRSLASPNTPPATSSPHYVHCAQPTTPLLLMFEAGSNAACAPTASGSCRDMKKPSARSARATLGQNQKAHVEPDSVTIELGVTGDTPGAAQIQFQPVSISADSEGSPITVAPDRIDPNTTQIPQYKRAASTHRGAQAADVPGERDYDVHQRLALEQRQRFRPGDVLADFIEQQKQIRMAQHVRRFS